MRIKPRAIARVLRTCWAWVAPRTAGQGCLAVVLLAGWSWPSASPGQDRELAASAEAVVEFSEPQLAAMQDANPTAEIHDPLVQDLMQPSPSDPQAPVPESPKRPQGHGPNPADSERAPASPAPDAGPDPNDRSRQVSWQRIVSQMRETQRRIAAYDADLETCLLQDQVLKELDWLIERAAARRSAEERSGSKSQAAGQESAPREARAARDPSGPSPDSGQPPDPELSSKANNTDPRQVARRLIKDTWGHLPDRKRAPLLNAPVDQFLPAYEELIEDYYERLSRQRSPR